MKCLLRVEPLATSSGIYGFGYGTSRLNVDPRVAVTGGPKDCKLYCTTSNMNSATGMPNTWKYGKTGDDQWTAGPTLTVNIHDCESDVVGSSSL